MSTKNILITLWATLFLTVVASAGVKKKPLVLHVDPMASPHGDGSTDAPFRSLEEIKPRLLKFLRGPSYSQNVEVRLASGCHLMNESFILDYRYSFPEYSRLTIVSTHGSNPARLFMGSKIELEKLSLVTDKSKNDRISHEARGYIRKIDLRHHGLITPSPEDLYPDLDGGSPEFFFDGKRLPLSRYPNVGQLTMGQVIDNGRWHRGSPKPGCFSYKDHRHDKWLSAIDDGLWFNGFWRIPWQSWSVRVAGIDVEKRVVTHSCAIGDVRRPGPYGGIGCKYARKEGLKGSGKEPYVVLNALEEIDQPGEWCIDYPNQVAYIWPPEESGELMISHNSSTMIALNGVSNVTIDNIRFEYGRENAIEICGGSDCLIEKCHFEYLGGWGVILRGGFRNGVNNSSFIALGKGGIEISGGDIRTLTKCHNYASNNDLSDLCHLQTTWAPAIQVGRRQLHGGAPGFRETVGVNVKRNRIYDLPHSAILYGGCLNVIEENEIYDVAKSTHDVGVIYTRHDWTSRGNMLRKNHIHSSPRANGIYIDDGDSGDTVIDNTIEGVHHGILIGGGRDNKILDNMIINCKKAITIDSRGIERKYNGDSKGRRAELEIVDLGREIWSSLFPQACEVLTDHPEWPVGNVVKNNKFKGCIEGVDLQLDEEKRDEILERMIVDNNMEIVVE